MFHEPVDFGISESIIVHRDKRNSAAALRSEPDGIFRNFATQEIVNRWGSDISMIITEQRSQRDIRDPTSKESSFPEAICSTGVNSADASQWGRPEAREATIATETRFPGVPHPRRGLRCFFSGSSQGANSNQEADHDGQVDPAQDITNPIGD